MWRKNQQHIDKIFYMWVFCITLKGRNTFVFGFWSRYFFLVPDSCWATVRNSNSIYAYKRGLHIIQNNKNDACFCSFSTIWQLFWGFLYLLWWGVIFSNNELTLILIWFWCVVLNATFSNISAISWRPVLVVEEAGEPECTF